MFSNFYTITWSPFLRFLLLGWDSSLSFKNFQCHDMHGWFSYRFLCTGIIIPSYSGLYLVWQLLSNKVIYLIPLWKWNNRRTLFVPSLRNKKVIARSDIQIGYSFNQYLLVVNQVAYHIYCLLNWYRCWLNLAWWG